MSADVTVASRAWMICAPVVRVAVRPSAKASADGRSGATTSTTRRTLASSAVADTLSRTAFSAQSAFRPRAEAMLRAKAAVSFSIFRAISLPACFSTSSPPPRTGWAAPMLEAGCMAATSAASVMNTPAEPALAPAGPTQTRMGTSLASIFWTISRVASRWPPGVSSTMATAWKPSAFARARPASTYSVVPVVMGAFTSSNRTRGRAGSTAPPDPESTAAAAREARRRARAPSFDGGERFTFTSGTETSRTPS
jgi:hypothetical protein